MILLDNVYKTYSAGNTAVDGISLRIAKGEFVFVVGPSGSGKTTLFKLLLKELEPTSGAIYMNNQNIRRLKKSKIPKMRRGIGVVFQDFRLLKDRTVYENIAFAERVVGKSAKYIKKSVPQLLETVGLSDKGDSFPDELSGGEQQRVALARALANNPPVILADEPTGNLDPDNAWTIMQLLDEINKRGTTVIVVTHNHEIVDRMHKRVIAMEQGVITNDTAENKPIDPAILSKISDMDVLPDDITGEEDLGVTMVEAGTLRRLNLSKYEDVLDTIAKVTDSDTDVIDYGITDGIGAPSSQNGSSDDAALSQEQDANDQEGGDA